jgi:hypothetical protein
MDVRIRLETTSIKQTDKLKKLLQQMKEFHPNPTTLLPSYEREVCTIVLRNSCSSFANAIRRVLIEELEVKCLTFDVEDYHTDDMYSIIDELKKSINLLPIYQNVENCNGLHLKVTNETNEDLLITTRHFNKTEIFSDLNIPIVYLKPGCTLKIDKFSIIRGYAKDDAGCFSLLDNVKYNVDNFEPYNMFTKKGEHSIEHNPKDFTISFTTSGNIKVKRVIELLHETLESKFKRAKYLLENVEKSIDELEITESEDIYSYKFKGEYTTLSHALAQYCYNFDNTIPFCVGTIYRYDSEYAIVRIKNAQHREILIRACNLFLTDLKKIKM